VTAVHIEPWGKDDLPLLEKLLGDPKMTEHLGGPESPEKIAERQVRYERFDSSNGRMLKIIDETSGEPAGWVGYWEREWRGGQVYEIGWAVLPAFQGQGIAGLGTAQAIDMARSDKKHRYVHAFPSVNNGPSNALCRRLAFTLLEELDFEYPPGNVLRCNDWRLDLGAADDVFASQQLSALAGVDTLFGSAGIPYWLFGGWAVDFYVGAVTRAHDDVDIAVWLEDVPRIAELLEVDGWSHAPSEEDDGGTGYERDDVRLELTYLTRDDDGGVYIPLRDRRAPWPEDGLTGDVRELRGVRARVLALASLVRGKSSPRDDPDEGAKDRADLRALLAL
jgi:RimJ/RimL family protein N-acetyltransferase